MFSIFNKKPKPKLLIFIVEDNEMYLQKMLFFIRAKFEDKAEVKGFKAAELMELELKSRPGLIIMDHFLDSRYADAMDGYSMIKSIHDQHPATRFIMHSSQTDIGFAVEIAKSGYCSYIAKDDNGLNRIGEYIAGILK